MAMLRSQQGHLNAEVVEQFFGVMRSLSFDHAANIRELVEAGACAGGSLQSLTVLTRFASLPISFRYEHFVTLAFELIF